MEKRYKNDFGELEKLIDNGKITSEHPYFNLYNYIKETNKETIRKNNIRKKITKEINTIKQLIMQQFDNNCGIIDLQMQPYLIEPYKQVFQKYNVQLERIDKLENENEFEQLLEEIYEESIELINENENIVNENIQKYYESIMKECNQALNGIKHKGKYLIKETNDDNISRRINRDAVKELTQILGEKELEAFFILERLEKKRFQLSAKCLELEYEIENSKDVVYTYLLEIIQKKLKEKDIKIFEQLELNKNIYKKLQLENIVTINNGEHQINLTTDRLRELKITGKLFEYLNIRCRLQDIETKLKEKIKNEKESKNAGKIIDEIDFETIEPRHVDMELERLNKQYRDEKITQYHEIIQAIANIERNKEVFKTPIIKKLEQESDTNILTIYMPSASGITTTKNAIYISKILIDIDEDKIGLEKFLQNEKVSTLPSNEDNIIANTVRRKVNNYINNNEFIYSKKLIKEIKHEI